MNSGIVLEIQHFTVQDGPGIRTTVFLKGCQLRCLWCHNPESIRTCTGELSFIPEKCLNCGACFQICPQQAHYIDAGKNHRIHRDTCTVCGNCAKNCIGGALSVSGKQVSAEQIVEELLQDLPYYRESGGGVTFSGGEPMMQSAFVKELLVMCKRHQLHTALETNLCYPYAWLDGVRENVDLFLADWKESDCRRHRIYTGAGNEQIYANIRRLCEAGHQVLLRCPLIPGYNDRPDHLKKIADLTQEFPQMIGAELLPYHRMGIGKVEKYGLQGKIRYIQAEEPSEETVNNWIDVCIGYGGRITNQKE